MEVSEEKIEEYRGLLENTGLSKSTVSLYISVIKTVVAVFDDLNDDSIESYTANFTHDCSTRAWAVEMFREWLYNGTPPRKYDPKKDKRKRKSAWKQNKYSIPQKETPKGRRYYYDNIFNKVSTYKDSHSAMWCGDCPEMGGRK